MPAVVVRGELNGLGVVRSLARAGVPSIVVDTTNWHAAMWSRHTRGEARRHIVPVLHGPPLIDELLALQTKLAVRPVLMPTDEMAAHSISEFRDALAPHYRLTLPEPSIFAALSDKAAFRGLAEANELPIPRTIEIARMADIAGIRALELPIIVKPADKRAVQAGKVERINWLDNFDDAEVVCRRMLGTAGALIAQEWIEGSDAAIYFVLFYAGSSDASRRIFIGRKLASHPPGLGSTAVCVPAPEAASCLLPVMEKFLACTAYRGLGSLEFKWESRADRFVIIEPTVGRTDWQEEIAALNGCNLPLVAYCDALGIAPPPDETVPPVAWRESFRHIARGFGAGMRVHDGYFRLDDPLPALPFAIDFTRRNLRRLLTRPLFERRKPPFRRRRIA